MIFDKNKKFNWVAGKVGQTRQTIRASLEESTQRALTTHQDVKIPDGSIVINKDLLQEIRDLITLCTLIDKSGQCKDMSDKLDKLYPFLNQ